MRIIRLAVLSTPRQRGLTLISLEEPSDAHRFMRTRCNRTLIPSMVRMSAISLRLGTRGLQALGFVNPKR